MILVKIFCYINDKNENKADFLKFSGNEAFKSQNYVKAIEFYYQAINIMPNNYINYNNRAAAFLEINEN